MANKNDKTVVIVTGPTATGKTAVAIELAAYFETEIISADSRQCYRELNIGVARPSPEQLARITHHFIATHSIHEEVTAAVFEQYALQKAVEIFQSKDTVVMVGGTGLYIKAFCEGLDEIPHVEPGIRAAIIKNYEEHGLPWLQSEVGTKDPAFYKVGEIQNPQRLMRALEVVEATGISILDFRQGKKAERDFTIVKVGLELPREALHLNIETRVDRMVEDGLVKEAHQLLPFKELNALQTVGYKELFEHFEKEMLLEEAIEHIKINTRQYAKRQMTWFKKDEGIKWFGPGEISEMINYLRAENINQ